MTDAGREFTYGRADFEKVRHTLYQLTGIKLADSKDSMVYSRLVRRLRALKVDGFTSYLRYLENHPEEEELFINSLTTNLTSFFREAHHFDILAAYLQDNRQIKRIWCAASSTGEEPYSIAMTVAETLGRFDTTIEIIASDIDSQVLATAATGVYPLQRIEAIDPERRKRFFHRGVGNNAGKVRVVPELRRMISFRRINLLDAQWDIKAPVDIIFCRNVMIYFDKPTQEKLLQQMINLMPAGGLYVAGHSENFSHMTHLVKPAGKTTYWPNKGARSQ
jgi:chemotaxis protein methyltransferase CheR